jgi:hypothetical protein
VLDAVPGGVFHLDINGVPVRGRYLELDPPHRLLISWGHAGSDRLPPGSSTVEITLTPTPGGIRVTVEHRDLPPGEAAQHAAGWPHFLARLTATATGRDPGPDPFAQTTAWTRDGEPNRHAGQKVPGCPHDRCRSPIRDDACSRLCRRRSAS